MLRDEMKAAMLAAMKAGEAVKKNILRLALGEIQTAESRTGKDIADADVEKILRKLIKSITESRDAATEDAQRSTLSEEIEILQSLLPQTLTPDEIVAALEPVHAGILAADNNGQATGVAMKHLKGSGAVVEGRDVSAAVAQIRA